MILAMFAIFKSFCPCIFYFFLVGLHFLLTLFIEPGYLRLHRTYAKGLMNIEYGQIPGRTREFSLVFITVQTRFGAKPVSCLIGAGAYTPPKIQQRGHLTASSAEVKNMHSNTSILPHL